METVYYFLCYINMDYTNHYFNDVTKDHPSIYIKKLNMDERVVLFSWKEISEKEQESLC